MAVLPVQPVVDEAVARVEDVEQLVGVPPGGRSEHHHLELGRRQAEENCIDMSVSVFLQHVTLGTVWGRVSIWHRWFAAPPRARWGWRWGPPRGRTWGCCGPASRPGPAPASTRIQGDINQYFYIIRGADMTYEAFNKEKAIIGGCSKFREMLFLPCRTASCWAPAAAMSPPAACSPTSATPGSTNSRHSVRKNPKWGAVLNCNSLPRII